MILIEILVENGLGSDDDEEYYYEIKHGGEPFVWEEGSACADYLEHRMNETYFMGKKAFTDTLKGGGGQTVVNISELMDGLDLFLNSIEDKRAATNAEGEAFAFVKGGMDDRSEGIAADIYERMSRVGRALKKMWNGEAWQNIENSAK